MTGDVAITQVMTGVYRIPALDGDNADRRAQLLEWLQEIVQRVWYAKSWSWRRSVLDPFTLASGVKKTPEDFQAVGETRKGGLWVKATGDRLHPASEQAMRDLRNRPGGAGSGDPTCYSIYGQDDTDLTAEIVCNTTANTQLILAYELRPPVVADDDEDGGLPLIPAQYHQSAIVPALRTFARERKGDAGQDPEQAILRAIATIAAAERPDADLPTQSPRFSDSFGGFL